MDQTLIYNVRKIGVNPHTSDVVERWYDRDNDRQHLRNRLLSIEKQYFWMHATMLLNPQQQPQRQCSTESNASHDLTTSPEENDRLAL